MAISIEALNRWCEAQYPEQKELLMTLAAIPAPSHHEQLRAEFISNWLRDHGAENVLIDEAMNVVLPLGWGESSGLCVLAHMDVVFPDTDPLPVREENGKLYAPGVGDDTANVVALMLCARYFLMCPEQIPEPLLLVFNSCEEGLGNLKGVRQIIADYGHQIRELVSFDCQSNGVISRAVGSERWQVTVTTRGGHSFSDFGTPSAIDCLAQLIVDLHQQPLPRKDDCKTTFNVGLISGGTSINTIAQQASMTYEYRSDDRDCLTEMADQFRSLVQKNRTSDVCIEVTELGIRPCGGNVPQDLQEALTDRCRRALKRLYDDRIPLLSASTDANIPLSMGIPAATFGLYRGGGAHTREEYVQLDSLTPGLKTGLYFFLDKVFSEES